ncbi:putative Histidine kinase [Candidatus Sulfobium mesophilum]|uniref:histidine kinase n=1 Tax=Candidatus Sulfobium mesophilum TaxID=2016548 RepID=A0A2U3QGX0_9BACT|nr:putative Histidine kinase [Candidatus Sulfobium mesophilum]
MEIFKHNQSERVLANTQLLLRKTFDALQEAVFIIDAKTVQITDCNSAASEMFGYSRKEILGQTTSFLHVNEAELQKFRDHLSLALRERGHLHLPEFHMKRKNGDIFTTDHSVMPLEDDHGERIGWVSVIRDITERMQAEEALRAREAQLSTLIESLPFELFGIARDGRYFLQNEVCRKHWGDFIGKTPKEVANDQNTLNIWLHNNRRAFAGEIVKGEIELMIGGEKRYVYNVISPILSKGQVDGIVGFNIDITERKQTEKELEEHRTHLEKLVDQRTKEISALNGQLRQSQKLEAVGILAGGIAHEFSNILTTMKGSMYLIQKKLPEGSQAMKYAEQILASMKKANTLSQGLLTFSRKQKITLKPVHLNEIIRSVGKMLSQLIGEDMELAVTLSGENPKVMADVNQIEQVLVNLVTNARDAMPAGGRLSIGTSVMNMDENFAKQHGYGVSGEYVVLTVSDSGTGIDEAIRGKIFEPFFTTKVVGKGSGLGLAVTYGIVKQHKGFIDAESIPGEGTTFKIYFPTVKVEVNEPLGQDISPTVRGSETVLLAEDDEDARTIMGEMLRMGGYTVLEAGDGEEAIRVYRENKDRPQLVFLDVRMPKKNGREVYEEIKQIHPATKFLFISGYTADIMDSLGVGEGGINFISKAASPDEILGKIREVLDQ